MNSNILMVGMLAVVLSACGAPTPKRDPVTWTKVSATSAEIAEAKKAIAGRLKDPSSARFGNAWAMQGSNGHRNVCIYVNAKNSFGGYTGQKITYYSEGRVFTHSSTTIGKMVPSLCTPRVVK